jgi:hypothetical protein
MSKKKQNDTTNIRAIYEFCPDKEVSNDNVVELLKLIRIGISGDLLEKASEELKQHFKEVA